MMGHAAGSDKLQVSLTDVADVRALAAGAGEGATAVVGPGAVFALSPGCRFIAAARGSTVVAVPVHGQPPAAPTGVLKPRARVGGPPFVLGPAEGDVTAVLWCEAGCSDGPLLVAGTSAGITVVLTCRSALLHRQRLRPSPVLCIRHGSGPEVAVLHADGVLAVVHGAAMLQLAKTLPDGADCPPLQPPPGPPPPGVLAPVPAWSVLPAFAAAGIPCSAFAFCPNADDVFAKSADPPPVLDFAVVPQQRGSATDVYGGPCRFLLTAGTGATVATFRAPLDSCPPSAVGMAHYAARKAARAAVGFASTRLWGTGSAQPAPPPGGFTKCVRSSPAVASHTIRDPGRTAWSVCVDPSGRTAAVGDSLGRVSIVDTAGCAVIRMLKGCRDAQLRWFHCVDSVRLCVYHPRRGVVEAWDPWRGFRLAAAHVGMQCTLLAATRLGGQQTACFLVTAAGELQRLELLPLQQTRTEAWVRAEAERRAEDDAIVQRFGSRLGPVGPVELFGEVDCPALVLRCALSVQPAADGGDAVDIARLRTVATAALVRVEELTDGMAEDPPASDSDGDGDGDSDDDCVRMRPGAVRRALVNRLSAVRAYTLLAGAEERAAPDGSDSDESVTEAERQDALAATWRDVLTAADSAVDGWHRCGGGGAADPDPPPPIADLCLTWDRPAAGSCMSLGRFLRLVQIRGPAARLRLEQDTGSLAELFCCRLLRAETVEQAEHATRIMLRAAHCVSVPSGALLGFVVDAAAPTALLRAPVAAVAQLCPAGAVPLPPIAGRRSVAVALLCVAATQPAADDDAVVRLVELARLRQLLDLCADAVGASPYSADWLDTVSTANLASGLSSFAVLAAAVAPVEADGCACPEAAAAVDAAKSYAERLGDPRAYHVHAALCLSSVQRLCTCSGIPADGAVWSRAAAAASESCLAVHRDAAAAFWSRCADTAMRHALRAADLLAVDHSPSALAAVLACLYGCLRDAAAPVAGMVAGARGRVVRSSGRGERVLRLTERGVEEYTVSAVCGAQRRLQLTGSTGSAEWLDMGSAELAGDAVEHPPGAAAIAESVKRQTAAASAFADKLQQVAAHAAGHAESAVLAAGLEVVAGGTHRLWWRPTTTSDGRVARLCADLDAVVRSGSHGADFALLADAAEAAARLLRFALLASCRSGGPPVFWRALFSPAAHWLLGVDGADAPFPTALPLPRSMLVAAQCDMVARTVRCGKQAERAVETVKQVAAVLGLSQSAAMAEVVLPLLLKGDDADAEQCSQVAAPEVARAAELHVLRLRLKHTVAALLAADSQGVAEQRLNLVSAMPPALVQWAQPPGRACDEEQVQQWVAARSLTQAVARLRLLAARIVESLTGARCPDADRAHETLSFAQHLAKNL